MSKLQISQGPLSISLYVFLAALCVLSSVMFGAVEMRRIQNHINIFPLSENYIPVSCQAQEENEGKLVHIDCPLHKLHMFHPPSAFAWNLRPYRGVFLEMRVELYQWVLRTKVGGFYFGGEWSTNLVDSTNYPFLFYNSHINPDFFPNINGAGRSFASEIYGGDFRLSRKYLTEFHSKKQLHLIDDHYYTPPAEKPPTHVSYANTQVYEDALYTGNPKSPKIGDLRITFWGSTATHVSAIAQQKKNKKNGITDLVPYSDSIVTGNRTVSELVYEGDYSANEMFHRYVSKRNGSASMIWGIKISFFLLLTAFVAFTYRILDTSVRVGILPLVSGSSLIASSVCCIIAASLWLLCDGLYSAILGITSLVLCIIGNLIWKCGYSSLNDSTFVSTSLGMSQKHDFLIKEVATTSVPPGSIKHFYQPV